MSGGLAYRPDRGEAVFVFQIKEGTYNTASLIDFLSDLPAHRSVIGTVLVRVVEARITVTCKGDSVFAGSYWLVTALIDARQALRAVMGRGTESQPDIDPDRCSFTVALHTDRDLVVGAAGITAPAGGTDRVGVIGQRVLAGLLPPRRLSVSTRKVKLPISEYSERVNDGRSDASRTVTGLDIAIVEPSEPQPALHHFRG